MTQTVRTPDVGSLSRQPRALEGGAEIPEHEQQPGPSEEPENVDDAMGDASADTAKVPDVEEERSGAGAPGRTSRPSETEEVGDPDDAMGDASADTVKTPDADDV
jgi:hypothetical protein